MLRDKPVDALELSALRVHELPNLVEAVGTLDVSKYSYVSVHAPSRFGESEEPGVVKQLRPFLKNGWPVILHPDAIHRFERWIDFGSLLCIENMDRRKSTGRYVTELETIFDQLPDAQ